MKNITDLVVYHLINKATGDDCALLFHSYKQALFELSKLKESPFFKDITLAEAVTFDAQRSLATELDYLEVEVSELDENT